MNMYSYLVSILAGLGLTAIALLARRLEGSWYVPSALFALLWAAIAGFSMLMAPDYYFSTSAILYITLTVSIFLAGSQLARVFVTDNSKNSNWELRNNDFRLLVATLCLMLIGCLAAPTLLQLRGYSIFSITSVSRYTQIANQLSLMRYSGAGLPQLVTLLLAACYAAAICGGLLFASSSRWSYKLIGLLSLFPILVFTMVYTTRATTMYAGILFIAGNISGNLISHPQSMTLFNRKNILIGTTAVILIFALFMVTQFARGGFTEFDSDRFARIYDHLRPWFFGNATGFSVWFDQTRGIVEPHLGQYTFSGLFDLFGLREREVGIFPEQVYVDGFREGSTNIYSLFRVAITDWSMPGSMLFFFGLGALGKIAYTRVANGAMLFIPLLSVVFGLVLWSFITSILAYNSIIMAFCIFFGVLFFIGYKK